MTAPMIGCSVALSKIPNFTFRCAATGSASISSKPMSITFLIVFIYIAILFFPISYTISASLWLVSLPFIFTCKKKERHVWAYPSFLLYISYSLLFDSVFLFIRSQVFFVLFKFSCIIVDAILVYCLQETF